MEQSATNKDKRYKENAVHPNENALNNTWQDVVGWSRK